MPPGRRVPQEHQRTVARSVWEGALASARKMEEKWPGEFGVMVWLRVGMLSAKMSALRWVLDEDCARQPPDLQVRAD